MDKKRRKILFIFVVIVGFHIAISIISAFIIQEVASNLLADSSKVPKEVIQNPEIFKKWLEKETRIATGFWHPIFRLFHHYPVGWIMTPTTKKIGIEITNKYINERNLSFFQLNIRLWAIAISKIFINSSVFGLCLFGGWFLVRKRLIKNKTWHCT